MSHSFPSANGRGIIPAFPGLSARSIPENPDIQQETLRLLLQYTARSSLQKEASVTATSGDTTLFKVKGETRDAWQTPRSELLRSEAPHSEVPRIEVPRIEVPRSEIPRSEASPPKTSLGPAHTPNDDQTIRPSPPPQSVSRSIAPRSQTRNSPRAPSLPSSLPSSLPTSRASSRASPRPASPQPIVFIPSSRSNSPALRNGQRALRKSVTIPNASRNEDVIAPPAKPASHLPEDIATSASRTSGSSESVSSAAEQNLIRRSNRSRAQPTNYYADPWGRTPIISEEPHTNLGAGSTPVTAPQDPCRAMPRRANVRKLLYNRELGLGNVRPLVNDVVSDLRPWKSWQGASGDLLVLAWSPDGTQFAAGAAAKSDEHNMVYNKPNNLLLGDLRSNRLKEIPDHRIPRPTSSTVDDPRLFMTVNNMQWIGNRLYTASFDKTVKIWAVDATRDIRCTQTLQHESRVAVMSVSKFDPSILATGTESISVWDTRDAENPTSTLLPFERETRYRPNVELSATALAWGHTPSTKKFLVGGLAESAEDIQYKGYLGLWRARESAFETIRAAHSSQSVFDIKWHNSLPIFATASPEDPHSGRNRCNGKVTRSIVRTYSLNSDLQRRVPSVSEFSCPALDVNEVTFCPTDPNGTYITASCTDGVTYVWDNRKGNKILHELRHNQPLNPMDDQRSRETADVGVRVALWGSSLDQFYTGASDGVLKRWDIRRATEDVLLENVATFKEEIMCGAFTEDQSHLLVGEPKNTYISGVAAANELVSSGQVVEHPIFGMGQGPSYKGPFASWARKVTPNVSYDQIRYLPLLKKYQDQQLDGPPPEDRHTLDPNQQREVARQIQLAQTRNRRSTKRKRQWHDHVSDVSFRGTTLTPMEAFRLERRRKRKAERREASKGSNQENRGVNGEEHTRRKIKKKNVRRISYPIISNTEYVDLTLDSDSETEKKPSLPRFDLNELLEELEDDNWFPGSGEIDPNFQKEIV
ncbi:hypothetical protein N7461_001044 [Penicillium sp. DV-2018c]|nr:hypothetical protein N7461_001044 [Penicillium sp. DV-2018c]